MIGITRTLDILAALCKYENGATAGTLAKVLPTYSKSQIEATLKLLSREGGVFVETRPHRPNIVKHIYHVDKSIIDRFEAIVISYDSCLHPVGLASVRAE